MREKVTAFKIWRFLYPMLIYLGMQFVVEVCYSIAFSVMLRMMGQYSEKTYMEVLMSQVMTMTMVSAVLTIPIFAYMMYRDTQNDKLNGRHIAYHKPFFLQFLWIIPFSVFTMYAANAFTQILVLYMPDSMAHSFDSTSEAIYGGSFLMQVLAGAVFGPIVEELLFRGLVYNRTRRLMGVVAGAIVSSLLFGAFHMNWVQAPYAALIGLACVFVYERYKTIIAPILLHMGANLCSVLVMQYAKGLDTEAVESASLTQQQQLVAYVMITVIVGAMAFGIGAVICRVTKKNQTPIAEPMQNDNQA